MTVKRPRPLYWTLDENRKPVPQHDDTLAWGRFFEDMDKRRVGYTEFANGAYVSTVFLGLDHRYVGDGPPLLFETMIFGGKLDGSQWRYSSWDDAETGHKAAVRRALVAEARK